MTKLPDYLQELAKMEKNATPGRWNIPIPTKEDIKFCSGSALVINELAEIQVINDTKFISELRNKFSMIISDFQKLLDERAEMIQVLEWYSNLSADDDRKLDFIVRKSDGDYLREKAIAMLDKLKGSNSESK